MKDTNEIRNAQAHLTAQDIWIVVQNLTDKVIEALTPSKRLSLVVFIQRAVRFEELLAEYVVIEHGESEARLLRFAHADPFPELTQPVIVGIDILIRMLGRLIILILHFSIELSHADDDSIINFIQNGVTLKAL